MILLEDALDYAGLFPPAGLDMDAAVRNFAAYRRGEQSALLGRFVVPIGRLDELAAAVGALGPAERAGPWELSVLSGADPLGERERIDDLHARHPALVVRAVERRVADAADVEDAVAALRGDWTLYLEVPTGPGAPGLVATVADAGACAKVRTGGVTADAFPSSEQLARFVLACADKGVAFKATAGLHHAVRADYRLTYEPTSACAPMHGFLNLFVGTVLLDAGVIGEAELGAVLEERDPRAFAAGPHSASGVRWRDRSAAAADVRQTRSHLLHSFGSCSFEEPVAELRALGALP